MSVNTPTRTDAPNGARKNRPFENWLSLGLVTLLALPAVQPLLGGVLTCGFDNAFHLWRAVQIEALLRQGVLFSRWAPHMAHGYGYPLYQFQSPFSAYLAAGLHVSGLNWTPALNAVYALAIIGSGWTLWLLARDLWGDRGAMITAVAYLYAPYHTYVSLYRASLSEAVAWAIVPLVLWGLRRWQVGKTRVGLATAVISFVLLMFTHDVTAYAFLPFMLGWVVVLALSTHSEHSLGRGLLALTLGLGGSAFFWLPAIAERHFIQFERAGSAWVFLYSNNFLPLNQLLALPHQADPSLLNDWPARGLGLLLALLAMAGTVAAWRRLPEQRWLTGFLALVLMGYGWLTVAASRPLWNAFPLLQTFQFPWRFLGPATLAACLLTGGLVSENRNPLTVSRKPITAYGPQITNYGLPLFLFLLLSAFHWGWLYPQHCPAPADTSLAGMVAWEKETDTVGTTASGELLPVSVLSMPQDVYGLPTWELRLSPVDMPEGAIIHTAVYAPLHAQMEVETAVPFTARFRTFFFPGWRAWVDGEAVPIAPADSDGLISFAVPNGRHTLEVAFGETPLRRTADLVSLLSLLALVLILWRIPRPTSSGHAERKTDHRWLWSLLVVGLLLLAGKWLVDRGHTPLYTSRLAESEVAGVPPVYVTFGSPAQPALVQLLGYEEWPTAVAADQPLPITLYWQALAALDKEYLVGLTLLDENGVRWSDPSLRDDRWSRAAPPTTAWPAGKYVRTALLLDMLSGTPPGAYTLQLSLFDRETFTPLTVYAEGQPIGPYLTLGQIEVQPPTHQDSLEAHLFSTEALTLHTAVLDRTGTAPGDTVLLTLFWSLPGREATAVTLSLLDANNKVWQTWPASLPAYGPGWWRSQLPLTLAVDLPGGRYTFQIKDSTGQTAVLPDALTILEPERVFAPETMDTAVNVALLNEENPVATLVGYSLDPGCQTAGTTCQIDLLWRANSLFPESYRVFVHVVDEQGLVVAQADGIPGQWQRPTTGWLPGEYILDSHLLTLPGEGAYTVHTGLYTEDGHRLTTADKDTSIRLSDLILNP